jgi:hypothetical protein
MLYNIFFYYISFNFLIFSFHSLCAKYHIEVVKTSKTEVKYQSINMNIKNNILSIQIASIKNIFEVISKTAIAIIIGKLKKIKKLNKTLIFKINIKKYNFIVFFMFKSAIFDEFQIDSKTHLFSTTISYLE